MDLGKLLIVDDEKINRLVLTVSAKKYGFDYIEATNGLEAIQCLDNDSSIKVVLLDLNMPQMDGYQVLEKINESYSSRDLYVYIVTASLKYVFDKHVLDAGININKVRGFYTKPVDMPSLFEDIKTLANGNC